MDPTKLPNKEAKSLSFLVYSLTCLILLSCTSSDQTLKIIIYIVFSAASFIIAVIKFIKDQLRFPLLPCKNRIIKNEDIICIRDKGFLVGFIVSIILVSMVKNYQFEFLISKRISFFIAFICTLSTIIHGTLRRYFKILNLDNHFSNFFTFMIGFITGIAPFFVMIYLIL